MRFNYILPLLVFWAGTFMGSMAQQPTTIDDMPEQWQYAEAFDLTIPTSDTWWQQFADPTLDSLIAMGIDHNYDVLMAQRRIEIAKQGLRQAQSAYYPQFALNGAWNKSRTSGMTGTVAADAVNASYFNLGVNMNWEIDVFGKITARARQSKANFNATRAEYSAVMVSMCGKLASAYFQMRTLQAEIAVLDRHIRSQKRVTEITEARHEAGLASMLDVSQARTTLYSTQASLASLQTSLTSTVNAIAVMLGVFPDDISSWLLQPAPLPDYRQIVGVGIPTQLLRRRPDIVQAEYQLAASAAAVGISKRDFLPTLSLQGSISTAAHKADDLFKGPSLGYTISPTLSWTLFDGMSRKASLESAKQQMQVDIDNYNLTVITAVQEVESAMAAYVNDLDYITYLGMAVEQAHEALTLSIDLYKQGLTTFINVTNSQIVLLQYSNQLVLAQGQALSDLVTLYEALGGGWQQ